MRPNKGTQREGSVIIREIDTSQTTTTRSRQVNSKSKGVDGDSKDLTTQEKVQTEKVLLNDKNGISKTRNRETTRICMNPMTQ